MIDEILNPPKEDKTPKARTPQEIAKERHAARTPEDVERIQTEWDRRRLWSATEGIVQLDLFHNKTYQDLVRQLEDDIALGDHKAFEHNFAEMQRIITAARDVEYMNTERLMKTPLFKANNEELESTFGLRGMAMPFRPANELRGNPHYGEGEQYRINCQSCVVAYELRRRGFNVQALGNTKGSMPEALSRLTQWAWLDEKGNMPNKKWLFNPESIKSIEDMMTEVGRYHISWRWLYSSEKGHIVTFERFPNGKCRWYDPQTGKIGIEPNGFLNDKDGFSILRVDNLLVNLKVAKGVLAKSGMKATKGKAGTALVGKWKAPKELEKGYKSTNGSISMPKERLQLASLNKQEYAKYGSIRKLGA